MNRRQFLKKGFEGILIGSIPLFYDCEKNPLKSEFERIVPGESIDGVYLGDTEEKVKKNLGMPDSRGWWDGIYGGGSFYEYNKGLFAGLTVYFMDFIDTVDCLWAISPYNGKTKDDIGIGSSLKSLHDVYGMPHEIIPNIKDEVYYYKNNKEFRITYKEDYITQIAIKFLHK